MPLEPGKSSAAFSHNVATEMHAGKPQKQAVAIAYSEKERTEDMAEGYAPIKGTVSSLAELNAANQRYHGQLEGETTFENTGDAGGPLSPSEIKEMQSLNNRITTLSPSEMARVKELSKRYLDNEQYNSNKKSQDEHIGFKKLEGELSHEKGVSNPAAVAAKIGQEKYGKKGMEEKAHAGDASPDPTGEVAAAKKHAQSLLDEYYDLEDKSRNVSPDSKRAAQNQLDAAWKEYQEAEKNYLALARRNRSKP